MELLELTASIRKSTGKGCSRSLRRQGRVPAVLYGPKIDPVILSVDVLDIDKILRQSGGQAFLNLAIKNGETGKKTAMIKDIQTHPVSRKYLHIDFYEVAMDKKIQVKVPVVLTGAAKGAEEGGTLQLIRREIDVLCLPMDIPDSISIDVSEMEIGDSVHVKEIPVPEHVEIIADTDFTVVTVSGAMVAEAAPEAEEEEVEEGEAVAAEEKGGEE